MTPEFAAYRNRLKLVALPLRLSGLGVVALGCILLIAARYTDLPILLTLAFVSLGLGWALVGYTVWLRTQWAKQNPYTGPR